MDQGGNPGLEAQLAASLDWWRDAGVDALFLDEPVNWIAPPEPRDALRPGEGRDPRQVEAGRADARGPRPGGDAEPTPPALADFPKTLAEFTAWWLAEPMLDGGRTAGRVAPRGAAGARLMVLVEEPERDDRETLLSGPQGRLLDAMLAAMGIAPEEVYVASVLPRHMPHPDWEGLASQGLGSAVAHHIALVAPRELVSFGANIPSLLGNTPPNSPTILRGFHHDERQVPWLVDRSLSAMLERPRWKAGFWQKWLSRRHGAGGEPG